jgi:hypothetical protein
LAQCPCLQFLPVRPGGLLKYYRRAAWLDRYGRPQTESNTERFRRRDFGHIDLQCIIDDPTAYSKPWGVSLHLDYVSGEELIEFICENEKDFSHLVGK